MSKSLRSYLLTGLIVWLPVLVTIWVVSFIVDLLDRTLSLFPGELQPDILLGVHIPGLGVLFSLLVLFFTGMIATNIIGQQFVALGERILARIPLVRSIYKGSKQVMTALFSSNSTAFREVLLVEYPRKGIWTVAFQTMSPRGELQAHAGDEMVSVFIPTTPNPTAGFLLMIPKKDTKSLTMSVDEALKFIISLGVVQPALTHK